MLVLATVSFSLLIIGLMASIYIGISEISFAQALQSLITFDDSKESLIVRDLRLPRAIIAAIVGANLAVAGGLMQAVTRNPLASPQVFGVNAGASLVVVLFVVLIPNITPSMLVYLAFIGAALGGAVVYSLASSGSGMSPVKLALAGMAVHMFFTSIVETIILFHEHSTANVLYWLAGSVDGREWKHVKTILPWSVVGILLAIGMGKSMTILGLGEDVAKGLGQRVERIRLGAGALVIILAGVSVAVAGPIGFVGLIVPHIVRYMVGNDYKLILPFSALCGAILLVYADVLSRFIAYPFESPVGIVTALIGGPFFLYLARRGGKLK
jgi:ABC-type Fe3+-siderophore transport system permease subunit